MVTISLLEFREAMPSATGKFSQLLASSRYYILLYTRLFFVLYKISLHVLYVMENPLTFHRITHIAYLMTKWKFYWVEHLQRQIKIMMKYLI